MKINYVPVRFGADPEMFFTRDGKIVGSEKVLPKEGLAHRVTIDGVQGEFNVEPATCRQTFSSNLRYCFALLNQQAMEKDITVSFAQTVKLGEKEMKALSKKSQRFGCAPSNNVHEKDSTISVKDGSKYPYRSAGGHIHLGNAGHDSVYNLLKNPELLVPLLDILVGNTCVLIDRDAGNVERRKVYGKAGEYRSPEHGLEYRTLSNFWLRSYPLMSFVLGMCRFAVNVGLDEAATTQIMASVDMRAIEKAINTNDFDLAKENFDRVKDVIASIGSYDSDWSYPLEGARLPAFEYFVQQGVDAWFDKDVMAYWLHHDSRNNGWEMFLDYRVVPQMNVATSAVIA